MADRDQRALLGNIGRKREKKGRERGHPPTLINLSRAGAPATFSSSSTARTEVLERVESLPLLPPHFFHSDCYGSIIALMAVAAHPPNGTKASQIHQQRSYVQVLLAVKVKLRFNPFLIPTHNTRYSENRMTTI